MIERLFRRSPHPSEADLSALVDRELSTGRIRAIEAHLDACESCRASVAGLREVKATLSRLPNSTTPRSFALNRVMAGVRTPQREPRRGPLVFAPAVALTLFVALLGADIAGVDDGVSRSSDETATVLQKSAAEDSGALRSAQPSAPAIQPAAAAGASSSADAAAVPMVAANTEAAAAQPASVPTLIPAPRTGGGAADSDGRDDTFASLPGVGVEDEGLSLLRVLQIVSGAVFVGSLVLVARQRWPRRRA